MGIHSLNSVTVTHDLAIDRRPTSVYASPLAQFSIAARKYNHQMVLGHAQVPHEAHVRTGAMGDLWVHNSRPYRTCDTFFDHDQAETVNF
jgi:hypothetical protein